MSIVFVHIHVYVQAEQDMHMLGDVVATAPKRFHNQDGIIMLFSLIYWIYIFYACIRIFRTFEIFSSQIT